MSLVFPPFWTGPKPWITRELETKGARARHRERRSRTLEEVRSRKLELISKTEAAVKDRLTKEISYWDHRAEELKLQEQAGSRTRG